MAALLAPPPPTRQIQSDGRLAAMRLRCRQHHPLPSGGCDHAACATRRGVHATPVRRRGGGQRRQRYPCGSCDSPGRRADRWPARGPPTRVDGRGHGGVGRRPAATVAAAAADGDAPQALRWRCFAARHRHAAGRCGPRRAAARVAAAVTAAAAAAAVAVAGPPRAIGGHSAGAPRRAEALTWRRQAVAVACLPPHKPAMGGVASAIGCGRAGGGLRRTLED